MGMLSGYKSSDDLLLLGTGRRVAASRVWALRAIAVVLLLAAMARAATGGPGHAIGAMVGAGAVYMLGLHIASNTSPTGKQA